MQTNDFDQPQPAPRKGCSKVVIWILVIVGAAIFVCCGGIGLYFYSSYSTDEATIRAHTDALIDINVPQRYAPAIVIKPPFVGLKLAIYGEMQNQGGNPMLIIMSMPKGANTDEEAMKQQMQQALQQQGQQQTPVKVEDTEERVFTINGKEEKVEVGEGTTQDGKDVVMAHAMFTAKNGNPGLFMLIVPKEQWKEEELEAMLGPAKEAPAKKPDAAEPQ